MYKCEYWTVEKKNEYSLFTPGLMSWMFFGINSTFVPSRLQLLVDPGKAQGISNWTLCLNYRRTLFSFYCPYLKIFFPFAFIIVFTFYSTCFKTSKSVCIWIWVCTTWPTDWSLNQIMKTRRVTTTRWARHGQWNAINQRLAIE